MSSTLSHSSCRATPIKAYEDAGSENIDDTTVVRATQVVSRANPYLRAHFPGLTVYPGVFLLETALQAVADELGLPDEILAGPLRVVSMRFLSPFGCGDVICLEAAVTRPSPRVLAIAARFSAQDGAERARIALELRVGDDA